MSEPISDIFLSELPYIMKLDPWAGSRVGETLVNVTAVNVYATHEVDCHFGNTSVEARWDEYSKTAACISPPAGRGDVFTGDVDFEVHLRGVHLGRGGRGGQLRDGAHGGDHVADLPGKVRVSTTLGQGPSPGSLWLQLQDRALPQVTDHPC